MRMQIELTQAKADLVQVKAKAREALAHAEVYRLNAAQFN